MTATAAELVLYSRPGCHLCEDAHEILDALLARRARLGLAVPLLVERNIEDDDELTRRYALVIPVVAVAGRELELATRAAALERFVAEALGDPQAGGARP